MEADSLGTSCGPMARFVDVHVVERIDHAHDVHRVLLDGGAAFAGVHVQRVDAFTEVGGIHLILGHVDVVFFGPAVVHEFRRHGFQHVLDQMAGKWVQPSLSSQHPLSRSTSRAFSLPKETPRSLRTSKGGFMDLFTVLFLQEVQRNATPPVRLECAHLFIRDLAQKEGGMCVGAGCPPGLCQCVQHPESLPRPPHAAGNIICST